MKGKFSSTKMVKASDYSDTRHSYLIQLVKDDTTIGMVVWNYDALLPKTNEPWQAFTNVAGTQRHLGFHRIRVGALGMVVMAYQKQQAEIEAHQVNNALINGRRDAEITAGNSRVEYGDETPLVGPDSVIFGKSDFALSELIAKARTYQNRGLQHGDSLPSTVYDQAYFLRLHELELDRRLRVSTPPAVTKQQPTCDCLSFSDVHEPDCVPQALTPEDRDIYELRYDLQVAEEKIATLTRQLADARAAGKVLLRQRSRVHAIAARLAQIAASQDMPYRHDIADASDALAGRVGGPGSPWNDLSHGVELEGD